MTPKTLLITGCSSGIGKATVIYAASRGHRVLASAPDKALLADIPDQAAAKYVIDVCDESSIKCAVDAAMEEFGSIDVLVNNAGYCQIGPIELLSQDKVERQFAVNVFGAMAMIRHVVPVMRKAGGGCVINLSSMMGLISMPVLGLYAASKYAVEGFSDALRMELKAHNIPVVLIEPGFIKTNFTANAIEQSRYIWESGDNNPYQALLNNLASNNTDVGNIEGQAEDVARVIVKALESPAPKARYKVTFVGRLLPLLSRCLPSAWMDRLLLKAST